jgi:hypothetical protein
MRGKIDVSHFIETEETQVHSTCRAYTPGTHARKEEDRLLQEFL